MSFSKRDPLLLAAKFVVGGAIGVLIFCAVMVVIAIGAVLTVERDTAIARLQAVGAAANGYPMLLLALALILAMMMLYSQFMLHLFRIVGSVQTGEPFSTANAGRLRKMGWLNLTVQLILLGLAALGIWFGNMKAAILAEDAINISIGAIVLTLVLFILARVFRLGAEMRDELEGTV